MYMSTQWSMKTLQNSLRGQRLFWNSLPIPKPIVGSYSRFIHTFHKEQSRNINYKYGFMCKSRNILHKCVRFKSARQRFATEEEEDHTVRTIIYYAIAGIITMGGLTALSVPLYRIFCQKTGRGGQSVAYGQEKIESMKPAKDRILKITFNSDTHAAMQWKFKPQQKDIQLRVGETALAFYTAKNPTDKSIIGVSTYNVIPYEAGYYFNKIQCFCFEEQRLNPGEEVEMPVFFYIDPDFLEDPALEKCENILLSYTFFQSKGGELPPLPGYAKRPQTG